MQVLNLSYRGNGDQRNSFHLKTIQIVQKTSLNIFLLKEREMCNIRDTYDESFGSFHSD